MTSIVVVKEPNMIFGPIPDYQSPQTHYIQPPPSIKCAPTRKRTQYRKLDVFSTIVTIVTIVIPPCPHTNLATGIYRLYRPELLSYAAENFRILIISHAHEVLRVSGKSKSGRSSSSWYPPRRPYIYIVLIYIYIYIYRSSTASWD